MRLLPLFYACLDSVRPVWGQTVGQGLCLELLALCGWKCPQHKNILRSARLCRRTRCLRKGRVGTRLEELVRFGIGPDLKMKKMTREMNAWMKYVGLNCSVVVCDGLRSFCRCIVIEAGLSSAAVSLVFPARLLSSIGFCD